jgi:DNA-binding LacI/PurR family transcriptional regulator/signal transduction histidine kinase
MVIGLFIQVAWHWHWPKVWPIVGGVIHAAEEHGVRVLIYSDPGAAAGADESDFDLLARDYASQGELLDGFILTFPDAGLCRYAESLHRKNVPVVTLGRVAGDCPRVLLNNFEATRQLVHRLASRGHRRIAFVAGPADNLCAQERLRGYRAGLHEAGLEHVAGIEYHHLWPVQAGAVNELARRRTEYSALIAFNDTVALEALSAFAAAGVKVPDEVEVVGFDNIPRAQWSDPPLATFDMQAFAMGHTAATRLIQRIKGESVPVETCVSARWVGRPSARSAWEADNEILNAYGTEGDLFASVQMQRLRRIQHVDQLLEELNQASDATTFAATFETLVRTASKHRIPVAILAPLLEERAQHLIGSGGPELARAHHALTAAALIEERRLRELGVVFASVSLPLREMRFEAKDESVVVEQFRRVLQSLEIRRAALFLSRVDDDSAGEAGQWWNFSQTETPQRLAAPDYGRFLRDETGAAAFFVMPLHQAGRQFGLVILDASSDYLLQFPDLVQQLSAAIHAVRMHQALAHANRELVDASRMAGIAEMATGVLHNIGNALNSVNTIAAVVADRLRNSKVSNVARIAELLEAHKDHLADFLTKDPKGRILLDYAAKLGASLEEERAGALDELHALRERIEHLNAIVAAQQGYANPAGLIEVVSAEELADCAVRICADVVEAQGIRLVRHFSAAPNVRVQRQRVVQILINLINNARDALIEARTGDKVITVSVSSSSEARVQIKVADNGIGIEAENLTRIFAFGFTTKEGGHGFGLHSSALAARELGGSLVAESEGRDRGATFILELPPA